MDFTREPIVETIITPREGFRLAVRSSKNPSQEEFLVEALEMVSVGPTCFYRHLERPRSFFLPAIDYEVVEVRETRVPLKVASFDGIAKPATREIAAKEPRAAVHKPVREEPVAPEEPEKQEPPSGLGGQQQDNRPDRKKDRKRGNNRRRRGSKDEPEAMEKADTDEALREQPAAAPTLIPPPTTLIREDLERLRLNDQYKGAFYVREESAQPVEKLPPKEREPEVVTPPRWLEDTARTQEEYRATPLPPEEDSAPLWGFGPRPSDAKPE